MTETHQSTCSNHPDKEAVEKCESCGKWVCEECAIRVEDKVSCPLCLDKKESLETLVQKDIKITKRTAWVILLVLLMVPFFTLTFLTLFDYNFYNLSVFIGARKDVIFTVLFVAPGIIVFLLSILGFYLSFPNDFINVYICLGILEVIESILFVWFFGGWI